MKITSLFLILSPFSIGSLAIKIVSKVIEQPSDYTKRKIRNRITIEKLDKLTPRSCNKDDIIKKQEISSFLKEVLGSSQSKYTKRSSE